MGLEWQDVDAIALRLCEAHPRIDPLTVRFTDLHRWVCELSGFTGRPEASNEGLLERIQMAWDEEFQDRNA